MNRVTKLALIGAALACGIVPAIAVAKGPPPTASLSAKAKAYGRYCQDQSKKHVAGQKGTPFSQCVTAMAKLANGLTHSPKAACAGMSRKHVQGEKGTPYSRCVAGGAKLLADQKKTKGP